MGTWEAILLGIVQGLSEFLPISSSGHLILVPWLLDLTFLKTHPIFNKTFDVGLHFGTLVGVVAYFRHDVVSLTRGMISAALNRSMQTEAQRLGVAIAIGTVPAVMIGGLGEHWIDKRLGEPWQIAIFLILGGLLLGFADRRKGTTSFSQIGPKDAVKIGFAQALALAPGVSRSGITITAARLLHFDRRSAARFSFLLLIPVTTGAVILKAFSVIHHGLPSGSGGPMAWGMLASAISGYFAIAGMLALVRRHSYDSFVIYRIVTAIGIAILIISGARSAIF